MQRDVSPVTTDLEPRDYRASALAFYGFAFIIAIDIGLIAAVNPDRACLAQGS